jgi:hypothetical protein
MALNTLNTQYTEERIIDLVRKQRNDLIKDFLDERHLKEYIGTKFRIHELSNIVIEFIKKDLKDLLISPVNLNHYEPLIRQARNNDVDGFTGADEQFFYKELEMIFKRYMYE